MILLLGGTHEGREIATLLNTLGFDYTLSVATELGYDTYKDISKNCIVRRFSEEALVTYLYDNKIQCVIDATHPHAAEVKRTAQGATKTCNVPYFRYARKVFNTSEEGLIHVENMSEAIAHIQSVSKEQDRILITGSKHVQEFLDAFDTRRCIFRIMPGIESMNICIQHGVPIENIIAIKAPCSVRFNQTLFEDFDIQYFVFKNSGSGSAVVSNIQSLSGMKVSGIIVEPKSESSENIIETIEALEAELKRFQRNKEV